METPNRLRVEISRHDELVMVGVRNGPSWWLRSAEEGGERRGAQDSLPPVLQPVLFAPERLLAAMWLEVAGLGNRAGRDVVIARAVPRETDPALTTLEFEFDSEYGTILKRTAYVGGVCTSSTEAINLLHGRVFSPEKFELTRSTATAIDNVDKKVATARSAADPALPTDCLVRRAKAASTVWLTGLPGAGKTTVAVEAERLLIQLGYPCCVLDEQRLRSGLSSDLGFAREDCREEARRVAEIALMMAGSGIVPIVAEVSPYAEDRFAARSIHERLGIDFHEIWVDTPREICARRLGRDGCRVEQLQDFSTSADVVSHLPYEPPKACELVIHGFAVHPRLTATRLVEAVVNRAPIRPESAYAAEPTGIGLRERLRFECRTTR